MTGAEPDIIAYQGEAGANSHIAAREVRPAMSARAWPTFEDVFTAVREGKAREGLIPVENSVAGRVAGSHRLLVEPGVHIIGEHFLHARHQLLGVPGATLAGLRTVRSHAMALGQCRRVIRELELLAIPTADTAGAARRVAEQGDPTIAAIAPRLAAEIYGLAILRSDIEDHSFNITRFVLIADTPVALAKTHRDAITSFVFEVRNVPAALYKVLGGFATNGVNMTRLESCQMEGAFDATRFYAEVEAHPESTGARLAFEEMAFFSASLRVLGVYAASVERKQLRKRATRARASAPRVKGPVKG